MPTYLYICECHYEQELILNVDDPVPFCPRCSRPMSRDPNLLAEVFIAERDTAINSGKNSRYKDWYNSPETQDKIKRGIWGPDGQPLDSLTDYLNAMQDPPPKEKLPKQKPDSV